jgi:ferrochelatase
MSAGAVVLLGFGGPEKPEDVRPFLDRVLLGRQIPQSRYEEVVGHYSKIGGKSPYNELTTRQANALEAALRVRGHAFPVFVAYRNTPPFFEDVIPALSDRDITRAVAIPLAAFGGPASADRYIGAAKRVLHERGGPKLTYVQPFYDHPHFVAAQAECVREALGERAAAGNLVDAAVIFTAHSVPVSMSDPYAAQFAQSASLVASTLDLPRYTLAYQSRSGSPTDLWLEPDVRDVLAALPQERVRRAIVAPLGFLCDHVEVLYDLDVEAQAVARAHGIEMTRAQALNDHRRFIEMLADLVEQQL